MGGAEPKTQVRPPGSFVWRTVNARTWISLINLAAIVVAFFVLFELPQYSGYAFYGLLAWILVSFVLLYAFRVGRPRPVAGSQVGSPGASGPAGGAVGGSGAPLPSASGGAPSVDFCIYCGNTLPAGSTVCPTCGHPVRTV